jgi:hypothetical protein
MIIEKDQIEDFERDRLRDQAIIIYQNQEEIKIICQEYDEMYKRKPAKIVVEIHDKIQTDTLPF